MSIKKGEHGGYEKSFKFEVFGKRAFIVFADNIFSTYKEMYPDGVVDFADTRAVTLKNSSGHRQVFFRIEDIYKTYEFAGIVAHEAFHMVRGILLHVGAELDNEVVAYHVGWLVEKIVRFADQVKQAEANALKVHNRNATRTKR